MSAQYHRSMIAATMSQKVHPEKNRNSMHRRLMKQISTIASFTATISFFISWHFSSDGFSVLTSGRIFATWVSRR